MTKSFNARKTIAYILYIFLAIVFVASIMSYSKQDSSNDVKESSSTIMGYRPVIVVTDSMSPAIGVNSVSIVEYCSIDNIVLGDIIMYQRETGGIKQLITHRVIDARIIDGDTVLTVQGDNNTNPDSINITESNFHGKVIHTYNELIPLMNAIMPEPGIVNTFAVTNGVIVLTIGIVLVYMILSRITGILKTIIWAHCSKDKFDRTLDDFDEIIDYQTNLLAELRRDALELQGLSGYKLFKYGKAKAKVMYELGYYSDNHKDVVKAKKRYDKLTRKFILPKDEH